MAGKTQCKFFVVRYAPDAVKNEFVNIGLVLMPPAGGAQIRFTNDWSRVRCIDPEVDLEVLQALEGDLREKLREMNGDHDFILRRIQDSFSNALQTSEFQACLADSPTDEADELAPLTRRLAQFPVGIGNAGIDDRRIERRIVERHPVP